MALAGLAPPVWFRRIPTWVREVVPNTAPVAVWLTAAVAGVLMSTAVSVIRMVPTAVLPIAVEVASLLLTLAVSPSWLPITLAALTPTMPEVVLLTVPLTCWAISTVGCVSDWLLMVRAAAAPVASRCWLPMASASTPLPVTAPLLGKLVYCTVLALDAFTEPVLVWFSNGSTLTGPLWLLCASATPEVAAISAAAAASGARRARRRKVGCLWDMTVS